MIKIINNTDLSFKEIGNIIDFIQNESKQETIYFGKKEWCTINYNNKKYQIDTKYLKNCISYNFIGVVK